MQHDSVPLPGLSGYACNPHMPPIRHNINTTTASSALLPPLPHYPGHFATAAHAPSYPHSYLTGGYVVASDTVQHWPTPLQIPPSMNNVANVNPYSVSSAAYGYAGNDVPWQQTVMPEQNDINARPLQQHAYHNAQSYIPPPPPFYRMPAIPAAAARTPLAQIQGVRYAVNSDSATIPNVVTDNIDYHTTNNRALDAHCEVNNDAAMSTMSIAHSARRLSTAKRSSAATMLMGSTRRSAYKTRSSYDTSATQTNNKSNTDGTLTRTSNTTTTAGGQDESCCVAAVINNGATEIGVALCALPSLTVSIAQYGDSCTFAKTLTLLYTQNPLEVLVPATTVEEPFTQTLLRCFGQEITFTAVQRRFYQSEAGVRRLHELRSNAELMGGIEDTDRYLCVAAANALLAYMEDINEMQFVPGSVRVRYLALEHYAEIPRASARALHIIRPAYDCPALVPWSSSAMYSRMGRRTPWTSSASTLAYGERRAAGRRRHHRHRTHRDNTEEQQQQSSRECVNNNIGGSAMAADSLTQQMSHMLRTTTLIDALPRTCTLHGQRFLRASLLQPLRDRTAIQLRQDVVAWLLADLQRALRLRGHLQLLAGLDMERLIASFSQRPRCMTSARRQQLVQCLLDLWHVLEVLQGLTTCLQGYLPHEEKQTTTTTKTNVKATQSSTPERPLLLHHIVDTLVQCELPSLEASLARYLDASVRPSSTTNTQATQLTTNTTASMRGGTSGRWTSERPGRRVVLGAAQAALSYNGPLAQPSFTTTNIGNGGDVSEDAMRRALLRASYDTPRLTHWQPSRPAASSTSSSSSAVFALLRICFAVRAPAGSVLDASRSGFSAQIGRIADYHSQLRQAFQLYSLVLRPDPVRLYCFSYSAAEEDKTRGGPFKYKYTGKEDYAHFVRAQLRRQEILQRQQEGENRSMHEAFTGEQQAHYESNYYNDDEGEAMNEESVGAQRQARRRLQRLRVQCTTDELEVLCAEARRYCEAILLEETRAVQPLLDTLRGCIGKLQAMTEAVALLDMLLSFTSYALMHRCVRPVLVDRNGRTTEPVTCTTCGESDTSDMRPAAHPLNESLSATAQYDNDDTEDGGAASPRGNVKELNDTSTVSQPFSLVLARHPSQYLRDEHGSLSSRISAAVPNTLQWACGVHVLLVTGPNTTGKTTLLRQTGQLVALAQSGCFIPAQSARLFIADRIVAHMLCDELPSVTQSSFKRELSELAALSHDVTCESLVLMDELGRSCASRQGFLLAWATVRFLCGRKVHALFTTHALALTELATVLPEVDNVHFSEDAFFLPCDTSTSNLSADTSTHANNTTTMTTTRGTRCAHCLQPGPCTRQQYGVALAAAIGLPRQVIADATQFLTYMRRLHAAPKPNAAEGTACDKAGEAATETTTTT